MQRLLFSLLCICLLPLFTPAVTSSNSRHHPPSSSVVSHPRAASPVKVVIDCDPLVWKASLDLLRSQVGVKEATGRNDGPKVKAYLASVRLPEGNPWCLAVQYWAFASASPGSKPPLLQTGLCSAAFNDALRRGTVATYTAEVGDLMFWKFLTSASGHVERIDSTRGLRGGWVITIGGNTSPEPPKSAHASLSSTGNTTQRERDGGGVYRRARNIRHPLARMIMRGLVGRRSAAPSLQGAVH